MCMGSSTTTFSAVQGSILLVRMQNNNYYESTRT